MHRFYCSDGGHRSAFWPMFEPYFAPADRQSSGRGPNRGSMGDYFSNPRAQSQYYRFTAPETVGVTGDPVALIKHV